MKRTHKQTNIVSMGRLELAVAGGEVVRGKGFLDRIYDVMPGEQDISKSLERMMRMVVGEERKFSR